MGQYRHAGHKKMTGFEILIPHVDAGNALGRGLRRLLAAERGLWAAHQGDSGAAGGGVGWGYISGGERSTYYRFFHLVLSLSGWSRQSVLFAYPLRFFTLCGHTSPPWAQPASPGREPECLGIYVLLGLTPTQ